MLQARVFAFGVIEFFFCRLDLLARSGDLEVNLSFFFAQAGVFLLSRGDRLRQLLDAVGGLFDRFLVSCNKKVKFK